MGLRWYPLLFIYCVFSNANVGQYNSNVTALRNANEPLVKGNSHAHIFSISVQNLPCKNFLWACIIFR